MSRTSWSFRRRWSRAPMRRVAGMLALVGTLVALLSGCTQDAPAGSDGSGAPSGPTAETVANQLTQVRSFALALGVDPLDQSALRKLGEYDLVVVDGADTDPAEVAALHAKGALVLGYLSVGTLEPGRPWFADARRQKWLLEHWDDWDEWYANVDAPGLRSLLVDEAERELASGFDGLFLDNTDMVEGHPDQAAGMQELVARLDDLLGPDRLLFAQNGDESVGAIANHLDGWNREDVTATYDFDSESYRQVEAQDHRDALATMARLRGQGLFVATTDYTRAADDKLAQDSITAACKGDAVPFISDIDLQRIPPPPPACP